MEKVQSGMANLEALTSKLKMSFNDDESAGANSTLEMVETKPADTQAVQVKSVTKFKRSEPTKVISLKKIASNPKGKVHKTLKKINTVNLAQTGSEEGDKIAEGEEAMATQ